MKVFKQTNNNHSKLLLFFAGWSASPELFSRLETDADTDLWICYDYRDLSFKEDLSVYQEIRLVAWSLGVWVASYLFERNTIPFVSATAINGTPCPIHNETGIPEAIFEGTLQNITEEGMHRFNRRMCGNREILQQYEQCPARPISEIREELLALYQYIKEIGALSPTFWTEVLLSKADRIFPADNLRNYWQGYCAVTEIEAPHYPFYLWNQWNEIQK